MGILLNISQHGSRLPLKMPEGTLAPIAAAIES